MPSIEKRNVVRNLTKLEMRPGRLDDQSKSWNCDKSRKGLILSHVDILGCGFSTFCECSDL